MSQYGPSTPQKIITERAQSYIKEHGLNVVQMPTVGSTFSSFDAFRITAEVAIQWNDWKLSPQGIINMAHGAKSLTLRCSFYASKRCPWQIRAMSNGGSDSDGTVKVSHIREAHAFHGNALSNEPSGEISTISKTTKAKLPDLALRGLKVPPEDLSKARACAHEKLRSLQASSGLSNPSLIDIVWSRPPAYHIGCSALGTVRSRSGNAVCSFLTKVKWTPVGLVTVSTCETHSPNCPARLNLSKRKNSHQITPTTDDTKKLRLEPPQPTPTIASTSRIPLPPEPQIALPPRPPSVSSIISRERVPTPISQQSQSSTNVTSDLAQGSSGEKRYVPRPSSRDTWTLQLSALLQTIAPASNLKNRSASFIAVGVTSAENFELLASIGMEGAEEFKQELLSNGVTRIELLLLTAGLKRIRLERGIVD